MECILLLTLSARSNLKLIVANEIKMCPCCSVSSSRLHLVCLLLLLATSTRRKHSRRRNSLRKGDGRKELQYVKTPDIHSLTQSLIRCGFASAMRDMNE